MKRSEINNAIENAMGILEKNHIFLPAFAYWGMAEWKAHLPELDNLRRIGLGWDVTDFGSGAFERCGSVLFTVRNGIWGDTSLGTPYAEKLIIQLHESAQEIPLHYHAQKTEDIINRGGGLLVLELYNASEEGQLDKTTPVKLRMDGIDCTFEPGAPVSVCPGASITLTPRLFHRFYAKMGEGNLVAGEVSSVNDDATDNFFLGGKPRFTAIVEDTPARWPLCNEYGNLLASS